MSDSLAQLDELFAALRDGELTADQQAALDALIASDPAALDRFIHLRLIQSGLTERFGEPRLIPFTPTATKPDLSPPRAKVRVSQGPTSAFRFPRYAYALAAALLLAAAAVVIYLLNLKPETLNLKPGAEPIATLIESAPGTDLYIDNQIANPGDEYKSGRYIIQSGSAELQLTSGASVRMIGYSDLSMQTAMHSTLTRGGAEFNCPASAVGYTVELPGNVRIVDLGTRFAVRVDDAKRAVVQVIEGKVRIDSPAGSHTLTAGEARELVEGVAAPLTDPSRLVVAPPAPPVDAAAFAAAVRELGPIAYWTGEEFADGATPDAITRRRAIIEGGVTTAGSDDNPHYEFDGSSRLRVDADDSLNASGNRLTILAWVRLDTDEHQAIVHRWADGMSYTLEVFEGRPSFAVAFANDYDHVIGATAETVMPVRRWVLLAGVYDGQTASLYVDGQIAASIAAPVLDAPLNRSAGPLIIGARSDGDWGNARGAIDDVAIFNTALTPQQIADLSHPTNRD